MIKFLLLTVPTNTTYETLKQKLQFPEDTYGVSNWVMKFPLSIYSSDLTEKHIFKDGIVNVSRCSAPNLQERWKYFVMTRGDGNHYYCTYHVFYEKCPLLKFEPSGFVSRDKLTHSYKEFFLPKCLVLISQQPYFKVQTNLIKIYRELRRNNPYISHEVNCLMYDVYERFVMEGRTNQWDRLEIKSQGRSLVCPMEVIFNYYIQSCNTHGLGSSIFIQPSSRIEILHLYTLPENSLYQLNYFFHLPISGKTLICALSAIFQEKQIIFTSYNQNSNVMLIQTLISMILPLKWNFLYVPNLPPEMIEAAKECFMPYIIGLHKKYLYLLTDKTDKIIIHVDTNTVQGEDGLEMMPQNLFRFLKSIPPYTANRTYLDWQKQVRICSILMISQLLSETFFLNKDEIEELLENKGTDKYFYDQFVNKSMMFQKLKEDKGDPLYQQINFLLRTAPYQRDIYLHTRFHQLLTELDNPVFYDNHKEWIKYYYNYNEQRKKLKKSMIFDYSSSTNSSFLTSKSSSTVKKLQIGGKKIGFAQSTVRL